MNTQKIAFIGAALGVGAQKIETQLGPEIIQSSDYINHLLNSNSLIKWQRTVGSKPLEDFKELSYASKLKIVEKTAQDLAQELSKAIQHGYFPIALGGDHSMAIGTWSGIISALYAEQEFGLIWFDAHMDAHTPETSPSMAIHGMPVAVLLGEGEPSLVNLYKPGPKINPKHLVLIGTRSFEEGEAHRLKRLGVKIFSPQQVIAQGIENVIEQSLAIVTKGTKGFGLSIDLDGFDPEFAPGVGSPEIDGLNLETIVGLSKLIENPQCKGLEIAEFNPTLDRDHKTRTLIETLIRQKIK